jgi:AP-1 complex subunit gamma-1
MDTNAVQRHRNTILDCLRDGDISIRRRALELSYALVNDSNVRVMTRELLSFLEVADNEFKLGMTTQICLAAERFAPNKRWHIDTVLRVLKLVRELWLWVVVGCFAELGIQAGNYVREEILASFIRLVSHTAELQFYTSQRLFTALSSDLSQENLTLAAVWVIGEFADVLLQGGSMDDGEDVKAVSHFPLRMPLSLSWDQVTDSDIVDLFELVLNSPYTNTLIRQFVLTAASKLSARLAELSSSTQQVQQDRIAVMLAGFSGNLELEIQQRAVEFGSLFARGDVRAGVLERMPPPEIRATIMGTGM